VVVTALVLLAAVALLSWAIRLRIRSIARQFQAGSPNEWQSGSASPGAARYSLAKLVRADAPLSHAANRLPLTILRGRLWIEALKQSDRVMQEGRERVLNLRRARRSDQHQPRGRLAETGIS